MNETSEKAVMVSREKYWEEKTADQKIEVLRDELARACRFISTQQETIYKLLAHQHGQHGHLLMPLIGADSNSSLGMMGSGTFAGDNGIPHALRKERDRR